MNVSIRTFKSSLTPWQVFQNLARNSKKCFFLDSEGCPDGPAFSYLGSGPFLEMTLESGRLKLSGAEKGFFPPAELPSVWRKLFRKYGRMKGAQEPFFTGGAVGFFGYETARFFEKIRLRPKPHPGTPDLYFGFYADLIVYDHARKTYRLISRAGSSGVDRLKSFFKTPAPLPSFRIRRFKPGLSSSQFQSMVRKAKAYIAAGDIYQANLSHRFSFSFEGEGLALYEKLRRINPSPFASYLRTGNLNVISSSPERLVSKKGRECETHPIAGTRPRRPGLEKELLASPKERAEHVMLVDLERSDLGRVCDFETVKVKKMMTIEKYSHVIHIVSKIAGRLSKRKDGWDLVRAMFPGGTITGCPKVRCMEVIDELEPVQRGLYTGSIGYFDFNGDLDLNIIIRTLILQKNQGYLQAGAGIVYDSDPASEYEETLHKGKALMEALALKSKYRLAAFKE